MKKSSFTDSVSTILQLVVAYLICLDTADENSNDRKL